MTAFLRQIYGSLCLMVSGALLTGCVGSSRFAETRVEVCVLRGGDDGLTVRFTDALKETIDATPPLVVHDCGAEHHHTINIPTSVDWQRRGASIYVTASVTVSSQNLVTPLLMQSHCFDDRLTDCASDIVQRSLAAWKIRDARPE